MSLTFKTAATLLATAFVAGVTLAATAEAKPFGGGFGGGFKPAPVGAFKPIGIKPGTFKPGPFKPIKPLPGTFKPIKPIKPPHAGHGHKHWVWGGITILAADYGGCGYEYYKWKSTGSPYWRHRYFDCRGE